MVDPFNGWVLGYCLSCPDERSSYGRFQVLATLKKGASGNYVADLSNEEALKDIFGPSGKVFWTQKSPHPENLKDSIVRFRCERGIDYGTLDEQTDWMIVLWEGQRNGWQVRRFDGYHLIDEENGDVHWRSSPRWIRSRHPGDRLFLKTRRDGRIIGPWRVGDETKDYPGCRDLLPEFSPPVVYSFPADITQQYQGLLFRGSAKLYGDQRHLEFLMYCPDPSLGEPIDLGTPEQLAKWFVEQATGAFPKLVKWLDGEEPAWRNKIKDELKNRIDDDHQVHVRRWERVESILDRLTFEADQANRLFEHPRFKTTIETAMAAAIEARISERSAEIEEKAKRDAAAAIDLHEKSIDDAQWLAGEEIAFAEAQAAEAKARLEEIEAKLREREKEWAEREQASRDLSAHLEESRERLARDIALYQSLSLNGRAADSKAAHTAPATRAIQLEGEPITSEADFVNQRLRPLIAKQLHIRGITAARALHAAIGGARATLIPSPAWARVYVDALGGSGRLTFVNVAPTWLAFEDLWNGGLGSCWERASDDPSAIEIVLLRDFNRALPQCYARPLLDQIAGFADELPDPGWGVWPSALRVLACPAAPEDSLPLSIEVARHFAAIDKPPSSKRAVPSPTTAHVAVESWVSWFEPDAASKALEKMVAKEFNFGFLTPSATRDLSFIIRRLEITQGQMDESPDERYSLAEEIRIRAPTKYTNVPENRPKDRT